MSHQQLVQHICAAQPDVSAADIKRVLDALPGAITAVVVDHGALAWKGFGTFERRVRVERVGRNPQTGEVIRIPPAATITFRPGKSLKQALSTWLQGRGADREDLDDADRDASSADEE